MQLYFIRTAQSTNDALWNSKHCNDGRCADPELTRLGWEQARRLARSLCSGDPSGGVTTGDNSGYGLTHLYCSLMIRSAATGWVIAQNLKLPLQAWEDLHEEGGVYLEHPKTGERVGQPGKNRAYFEARYPGILLPETLGEPGWWDCRPYESAEGRSHRARKFLAALLEKHGDTEDRVAVVSHIGFYNYVIGAILCSEPKGVWASLHNAAITRFDFNHGCVDLVYMNRTDFLPPDLIS